MKSRGEVILRCPRQQGRVSICRAGRLQLTVSAGCRCGEGEHLAARIQGEEKDEKADRSGRHPATVLEEAVSRLPPSLRSDSPRGGVLNAWTAPWRAEPICSAEPGTVDEARC